MPGSILQQYLMHLSSGISLPHLISPKMGKTDCSQKNKQIDRQNLYALKSRPRNTNSPKTATRARVDNGQHLPIRPHSTSHPLPPPRSFPPLNLTLNGPIPHDPAHHGPRRRRRRWGLRFLDATLTLRAHFARGQHLQLAVIPDQQPPPQPGDARPVRAESAAEPGQTAAIGERGEAY